MAINTKIELDLTGVTHFLDEVGNKIVLEAAKASMNRGVQKMRTAANRLVREKYNYKAGFLNKKMDKTNAKGTTISRLTAGLWIDKDPVSMLHFVVGSKEPRNQKGIAVSKRRALNIRIRKGQKTKLKTAFIAKTNRGRFGVFVRQTAKPNPLRMLKVGGVGNLFVINKFGLATKTKRVGKEFLAKEMNRLLDMKVTKAIAKNRRRFKR